LLLITFY